MNRRWWTFGVAGTPLSIQRPVGTLRIEHRKIFVHECSRLQIVSLVFMYIKNNMLKKGNVKCNRKRTLIAGASSTSTISNSKQSSGQRGTLVTFWLGLFEPGLSLRSKGFAFFLCSCLCKDRGGKGGGSGYIDSYLELLDGSPPVLRHNW